jgi:hypothetical protein
MTKAIQRGLISVGVLVAAGAANAAAPDFSALSGAVDLSTAATAILAVAALIAVVLVVKKGARMVLSMIGR